MRQYFNRIAINFARVSPFHLRIGLWSSTEQHVQYKRQDPSTLTRCNEQGINFESVTLDYVGGINVEGGRLLDSLCRAMNDPLERINGIIKVRLRERISFALQRYLHRCVQRRREGDHHVSGQCERFIPDIHFSFRACIIRRFPSTGWFDFDGSMGK